VLQQICEHILNYFTSQDAPVKTYTVHAGTVSPALSLTDGQRFLVSGSSLNDGVYTYHADGITNDDDTGEAGLTDETFTGTVSPMSVPRGVTELAQEIAAWCDKNADALSSPYQSENVIGVYSYTKATGRQNGSGVITWQAQFADRLKRWRRISL